MDKGGKVEASLISRMMSFIFGDDPIGDVKKTVEKQEAFTNIIKQVIDESKFTSQEIEKKLDDLKKAEGGIIPSFKNGSMPLPIPNPNRVNADIPPVYTKEQIKKGESLTEEQMKEVVKNLLGIPPRPISNPNRVPPTDHLETDKESYNTEYAFGKYSPKVEDKELGTRNISDLTLKELLEHQRKTVNNQIKAGITDENKRSSAMGAYQIISPTLKGLINTLGLDTNTKFTPELQDSLALYLLEDTGVDEYFDNPKKSNLDTFQNKVAHVWASLPNTDNKSSHDQSLAPTKDPFRKQLDNIQQEVEQGTITRLEGKYKILSIIRDAETELRYEEKINPPLPKARPK